MRNPLNTMAQAQGPVIKNLAFLAAIMAVFLSVSAQAGETVVTDSKTMAPAPPPPQELFGTGFYMGLNMGANVWQNNEDDRNFTNVAGDTLPLSGLRGGLLRPDQSRLRLWHRVLCPTIEGDFFYNGWQRSGTSTFKAFDGTVTTSDFSGNINTGAFMSNLSRASPLVVSSRMSEPASASIMRPAPVSPLIHWRDLQYQRGQNTYGSGVGHCCRRGLLLHAEDEHLHRIQIPQGYGQPIR